MNRDELLAAIVEKLPTEDTELLQTVGQLKSALADDDAAFNTLKDKYNCLADDYKKAIVAGGYTTPSTKPQVSNDIESQTKPLSMEAMLADFMASNNIEG